jgi:hypothetical protein
VSTGDVTQGRRIYGTDKDSDDHLWYSPEPGDYWRDDVRGWSVETPNGLRAGLANHEVVEHEDGTISVSPSILCEGALGADPTKVTWHGYLKHGVWREV